MAPLTPFVHKRILITVKTYPQPARHGVEVSCTGGVTEEGTWIRLFPIPYRYLEGRQQFRKYQWVEAQVARSTRDSRPESHIVDLDSISIVSDPLPTADKWAARKGAIYPLLAPSLCELERRRGSGGATLGIFKPRRIESLLVAQDRSTWTPAELQRLSQPSMFDRAPFTRLQKVPFRFLYRFECEDSGCKGHCLSVADWELNWSCLKWQATYGSDWEEKFRLRYETHMIEERDTCFYVGTVRAHPHRWIVVGLFYPPR